MTGLLWNSGKRLWIFEFSCPFLVNEMMLRIISPFLMNWENWSGKKGWELWKIGGRVTKIQIFTTSCRIFTVNHMSIWIRNAFNHGSYKWTFMPKICGHPDNYVFLIKWIIGTHENWKNPNLGGRFGATSLTALPI